MARRRRSRGVTTHRVQRSLANLTIGVARSIQEREEAQELIAAGETEQQYRIGVSGTAGAGPIDWQDGSIVFDSPFYPAPDRRDSSLLTPQFTSGYEMQSRVPVIMHVVVTGWLTDTDGTVNGVNLAFGAFVPGAQDDVKFDAVAHVTFQGWAAPALNDDQEA
jgi:hypothetical protein